MSNGFFVVDEGGVIAVDGGAQYGKEFAVKACADAGIDPKSIRLIVVSHPHVDHTCNVDELRKLSGAPIVVQKAGEEDMITAERPHVFPRNPIGDEIMEFAKKQGGMPDDYLPPITPDLTWEESFDLHPYGVAGKLIHTPGHSLADCCVILESGQAIIGDLVRQVEKSAVTVKLNTTATPELLKAEGYDEVIVAIGSTPAVPPIPGVEGDNVCFAVQTVEKEPSMGKDVVVIGGGEIGVEMGLHLAKKGHQVHLIEMQGILSPESVPVHFRSIFEKMWESQEGFTYTLNARCTGISAEGVTYVDENGRVTC
jgi:hypothetical protein